MNMTHAQKTLHFIIPSGTKLGMIWCEVKNNGIFKRPFTAYPVCYVNTLFDFSTHMYDLAILMKVNTMYISAPIIKVVLLTTRLRSINMYASLKTCENISYTALNFFLKAAAAERISVFCSNVNRYTI